jgi:propionyl-CoA carboxylase alpha chain
VGGVTIRRLLVANRGEIARRVFRTCRDLGIETVAVHSEVDAGLPFVREADLAVKLPGNTPAETYLRGDRIVAAAIGAGADAVHPGYGFLSENAQFARQVLEAGLTWIGPRPESIEAMGDKVQAKKLVAEVDVPTLEALAVDSVGEPDLPVLVKASAGGGGRGMRVVRSLAELASTVEQASAEAAAAFGDGTVFVEPYIERGRHVVVQVLADQDGNLAILGERDCSVQRRHQKVLEEAPAPGLTHETRKALFEAARLAAASVHYVGAGTVEFMFDPATERFWFLEMNTRLQVEHPVTECVTGIDLVAAQIAVAEGRPLHEVVPESPRGETPWPEGHAVEARLYAEDPAADWQPQAGRLSRLELPGVTARFARPSAYGIRVDSGYTDGDEVSTHYDAMLAKVIAWAPTRTEACRRLAAALARARIHGVRTNRDLLVNVLRHEAFLAGELGTHFLDEHGLPELSRSPADADAVRLSAFAAAVAVADRARGESSVQQGVPTGWRNVVSQPHLTRFVCEGPVAGRLDPADESGVVEARWYGGRSADLDARVTELRCPEPVEGSGLHVVVATSRPEKSVRFEVYADGDQVDVESVLGHVALRKLPRFLDPADQVSTGSLLAPMPGSVTAVTVTVGDTVTAGQPVLVLEAMKMQHTVTAPHDGTVTEIAVSPGDQVAAGSVLAVVSTNADEGEQQ